MCCWSWNALSFVLGHRNWMLALLFLEGAAICVGDKMYHVVMATEILMFWLMTLTWWKDSFDAVQSSGIL